MEDALIIITYDLGLVRSNLSQCLGKYIIELIKVLFHYFIPWDIQNSVHRVH
jgi:hypothetical protein